MDSYSNNSTRVRFTTTAYLEGSHQPFTTHYLALNNNVNKSLTTTSYEFAPNSVVSNSHNHRPYSNQNHSFSNISNAASNTTVTSQPTTGVTPVQQQHFVHQQMNIHQISGIGSQNTNSLYKSPIEGKAANHRPAINSQTCTDWSIHPSDSFLTNTFTNSITSNKNRNTPVSASAWNNMPHYNGPQQHQPANFVKESMMAHRNPAAHHTYQRTHQSYYMNASGDHSWSHPQNSNLSVTATQPHNYNPSPLLAPSSYPQSRVFPNLSGHMNHTRGSTGDNSRINQPITPTVANIHATQWNPPNPNINITTQWNNSTNSWARDENQNAWNGFEYSSHHSNAISTSSLLPRRDDPVLATGFEPWRYSPTAMIRQSQIPVSDGPNRPEYGLNTIETWKPSDNDRAIRNGNHNKFPRFNRIDNGPRIRMLQNCRQNRGDRDKARELWSPSETKKKDKQQQRSYNAVSSTNNSEVTETKSSDVIVKSCSKKSDVDTQLVEMNELQTVLNNWLTARHFKSSTSTKSSDEKSAAKFQSEIRIVDQKFIGIGSSNNKVESELIAMWNLLEALVIDGQIDKQHLPDRRTTPNFTNNNEETESDKKSSNSTINNRKNKSRSNNQSVKTSTSANKIPSLLSIVLPPRQNLPPHSFIYDAMYDPWANTPPHPQPWCPRAPWIDHINHLGPHPTGLVPYRDRPMVPWTSNPPHHMPPLPSNDMDMLRMSRGWVEDMNSESEMISPEDVFIHRMIMNQKEATRCTAGHNPTVMRSQMSPPLPDMLPGEWGAPTPSNKAKQSLDDKHVMTKHANVFPTENQLKHIHEVVEVIEKSLKSLSDQFVDEDHPLPPKNEDQDDDKSADQIMESNKERGDGDKAVIEKLRNDDVMKSSHEKRVEKKPKFQILKRPKSAPKKVPDTRPRVLHGVNRIGVFSKGLLVRGDSLVELVLLCGQIPTYRLLDRILKHLPEKINEVKNDLKYTISKNKAGFTIEAECDVPIKLVITLTSTSLKSKRSNNETKSASSSEGETTNLSPKSSSTISSKSDVQQKDTTNDTSLLLTSELPDDSLPKSSQLSALAELRHTKWFQSRAIQQESCPIIIRLLREMQTRVPAWAALSCWALENLVYLALSSSTERMRHGDAFRRLFEVVAGGILLPDGPGLLDPCEREPVDVLDCCSSQQLEDVTRHAQHALLLITFRSIHEVLGIPKITSHNARHQTNLKTNLKSSNKKQKAVSNDNNCGCKSISTQSCNASLTTATIEGFFLLITFSFLLFNYNHLQMECKS